LARGCSRRGFGNRTPHSADETGPVGSVLAAARIHREKLTWRCRCTVLVCGCRCFGKCLFRRIPVRAR
jgi:hypothetical protein